MQHAFFVSSTFRDMQAERDMLMTSLTPAMNRLSRDGDDRWTFMDLRWGINTGNMSEEAMASRVLGLCLDAVDSCKPHAMVFLGDRYGWVPDKKMIQNICHTKDYPPPSDAVSVTELEILYGVLNDKEDRFKDSIICFREMDYSNMDAETKKTFCAANKAEEEKLTSLKKRILERANISEQRYEIARVMTRSKSTAANDKSSIFLTDSVTILNPSKPLVLIYKAEWDAKARCIKGLDALQTRLSSYLKQEYIDPFAKKSNSNPAEFSEISLELGQLLNDKLTELDLEKFGKELRNPFGKKKAIKDRFAKSNKRLDDAVLKAILAKHSSTNPEYIDLLIGRLMYITSEDLAGCSDNAAIDRMLIRLINQCPDDLDAMKNYYLSIALKAYNNPEVIDSLKLLAVAHKPLKFSEFHRMLYCFNSRYRQPDALLGKNFTLHFQGGAMEEFSWFAKPLFRLDGKGGISLRFTPKNLFYNKTEELLAHKSLGNGYSMYGSEAENMAEAMWHYSFLCDYPDLIEDFKDSFDRYLMTYNDGQLMVLRRMMQKIYDRDGGRFQKILLN